MQIEGFATTNPDLMAELVEYPWSGSKYSEKIWGECENFEKVLKDKMVLGFVEGKPYDQIVKEMEKELGVERWKIKRLVRTEGAFISNQAQLSAYYKSGIEKYQYLARVDQRTSEICKELNGKVFKVQKAQAGENFPPLHPYCRSVTKAYFGDKSNETEGERFGKDNSEGKGNPENKDDGLIKGLDKSQEKRYNNSGRKIRTGASELSETDQYDKDLKLAKEKYDKIREDDSDIDKIAKNVEKYGFSKEDIVNIKNYIFKETHDLDEGPARLDPGIDNAESWERLTNGGFNENDLTMLRHELYERDLLLNKGYSFDDAHLEASRKYLYKTRYD